MLFVVGGTLALALFLLAMPPLPTYGNVLATVLIIVFGFFFVTVSSRITGLIGNSSNPISGMTIATLILTCTIFVALGWTGDVYAPIALSVGAMVCIAAANAGATSQDLKTGFLVGATPRHQQTGLMIGAMTSSLVIGLTTLYLHQTMQIGSQALPAPQATLMATLIKGLLAQDLPWGLVLAGVFITVTLELCGIHSLSFAVGSYLPDLDDRADLRRRRRARAGRALDRQGRRIRDQLRHALQLGPDCRRLAGRHPLRDPVRARPHPRRRGIARLVDVPARRDERPDRRRRRVPAAGCRALAGRAA